jgi:hypothetical protein
MIFNEQSPQDRKRFLLSVITALTLHILLFLIISIAGIFDIPAKEDTTSVYVVLDDLFQDTEEPDVAEPEPIKPEPPAPEDDKLSPATKNESKTPTNSNEESSASAQKEVTPNSSQRESSTPEESKGYADELADARNDFDNFLKPSEIEKNDNTPVFKDNRQPASSIDEGIDRSKENKAILDKWKEETAENPPDPRAPSVTEESTGISNAQGGGKEGSGITDETLQTLDKSLEDGSAPGGEEITAPRGGSEETPGSGGESRITWEGSVSRKLISAPDPNVTAEDFEPYEVTRVKIIIIFTVTTEGHLTSIRPDGNYPYTKVIDEIVAAMRRTWKFERGPKARGQVSIIINPEDI